MITKKLFLTLLFLAAHTLVRANSESAPTPDTDIIGSVMATENVDNYTYVQIATQSVTNWYAVPTHTFEIGEEVIVPKGGLPMKDFYSKALDRTFDMVYFSGSIKRLGADEQSLPAGHPPIQAAEAPAPNDLDLSGIERAEGGKTVAEIHEQKDELAGQSVVVRGKAVKVANAILGKNWVHLRDGSGSEGSNDLTLTTTNAVAVGDTITVQGILLLDKDFGSGYRYDVILEATDVQSR